MPKWLSGIVDVRPGELRRVGGMFSLLGLIITTSYILKPVRSALFLSELGSEQLPYVYILVAIVLGVVAASFAKWTPRINLPRLFAGAAYFFASNLLVFWLATTSGFVWAGFAFYVWVSIFTALMPSLFWLLANYVFYANEGRRLFPVVMAGGLLGSIVGGTVTSVLVRFVGTRGLLLSAAVILVGVGFLVRLNTTRERERMAERRSDLSRQERSRTLGDDKPWVLLKRSRYLSLIAGLIVLTTMTSTVVDYQFNAVVEQSFDTMDALTGFFGTFFAAINIFAFVLQLLVVGKLLSRYGVAAGLLVLPLALLSSSLAFLVIPRLLTAALIKTSDDGLSNSVNRSSVEVLYLPIALSVKNRLKTWLDLFVERVSRGLAGVTILVATSFVSPAIDRMSFIVIGFLLPWIALVFLLQREYVKTFRDSLSRRDISDFASRLQDPASLSVFRQVLSSADGRELVYALELLQGVEDPEILEQVAGLTARDDPAVRRAALRLLSAASAPPELEHLAARVEDDDPDTAAAALALWIRVSPEKGYRALESLVRSGDLRRIEAVQMCLTPSEELIARADIGGFVAKRCNAEDGASRRLAARAAGFLPNTSDALRCLPPLLNDSDIDVARAAAESVGRLRYEPAFAQLVEALKRRPLRAAVRKAIAHFGVGYLERLTERLSDESEELDLRRAIPLALAELDSPRAVAALFELLPQEDRRLHYQGIKGLGKLRAGCPDLRFPRSEVTRLLRHETAELTELASLGAGVETLTPEHESHRLLVKALEERIEFTRERIFRLVGLVHSAKEIFSAWDRIQNGRPAVRAAALEYLSNVLSRRNRTSLLPLIESKNSRELHERARELFGSISLSFDEALKRLLGHQDYWLAAIAATLAGELESSPLAWELEPLRDHPSPIVREAARAATSSSHRA